MFYLLSSHLQWIALFLYGSLCVYCGKSSLTSNHYYFWQGEHILVAVCALSDTLPWGFNGTRIYGERDTQHRFLSWDSVFVVWGSGNSAHPARHSPKGTLKTN